MDDASLDDFRDARREGEAAEEDDASADGSAPTDDAGASPPPPNGSATRATDTTESADGSPADVVADATTDLDPATTTYAWASEAVACEACGADTRRRWRNSDLLVCPECKDW